MSSDDYEERMGPDAARAALDRVLQELGLTEWHVRLEMFCSRVVEDGTQADCSLDASTLNATIRLALGAEDPFGDLVHECLHLLQAEMDYVAEVAFGQLGPQGAEVARALFHQSGERQTYRLERLLTPLLRIVVLGEESSRAA